MAWVDTPGRVPIVRCSRGAYTIEYAAGVMLARAAGHEDQPAVRKWLEKVFEQFGLHRALRLAGAKPGDTVKVGELTVALWDYPEPKHPASCEGVANYAYIVTEPIVKLAGAGLQTRAQELAPLVESALVKTRRKR